MTTATNQPRIAIVGAGPVGLSAAILLAQQGIPSVVYERRSGVASLPQAHVINTRTSEIFREMDVFGRLAEIASDDDKLSYATWSSSLAGTRFGRLPICGSAQQKAYRRSASPVRVLNMGQHEVGKVLLARLAELGQQVHFKHEVLESNERDGKATLKIRTADGKEQLKVFDYVLACDGASSTVREHLGIEMSGPASLARFASCYFRADLNKYLGEDTGPVHFIAGEDVSGSLISFDLKSTWALMCVIPPNATNADFTSEVMLELVRRAVGDPQVELELISVGSWNMSAQVAERFSQGAFFLLGDSAHRFPPSGGLGLNTGVQDAHNLVWKLAMVLKGHAPQSLLDSYEPERAPIARVNCSHSMRNAMELARVDQVVGASFLGAVDPTVASRPATPERDHGLTGDSAEAVAKRLRIQEAIDLQRPHFDALGLEIGYRYSAGGKAAAADYDYTPRLDSGERLPHAWVAGSHGKTSSLDLYSKTGFTLLLVGDSLPDAEVRAELEREGIAIRALQTDSGDIFPADHALLLRPDGHIAWHGHSVEASAALVAARQLLDGQTYAKPTPAPANGANSVTNSKAIRPTKLAHVVMRSNERFDEVSAWYQNLLSATIVHKDPMACFMTFDDEHHRLAVVRVEGMTDRPRGTVGLEHLAFTFGSLEDLLDTYERLKQGGVEPILTINHGGTTSLYYEDPDRNRVEIQVDNFDSFDEFLVFLQSGAMNSNPIGLSFDADEMLAKLRAGVPAKELQAYPLTGEPVEWSVIERLQRN